MIYMREVTEAIENAGLRQKIKIAVGGGPVTQAFADEIGLGSYFMRLGNDSGKLSFIGHGVGLELNEAPMLGKKSKEVIEEGMIIALELEMCSSTQEVVKLEDTLLITSHGAEILTITPRDLHQV